MKVSHHIATRIEGTFSEVMDAQAPAVPELAEVLETLKLLALVVTLHPALATNQTAQNEADKAYQYLEALAPA